MQQITERESDFKLFLTNQIVDILLASDNANKLK